MADIVLTGDTSGAITVAAPAVAGTNTLTLPASTGTVATTTSATALSTASGSAPSYSARAWVNFNGTGTVAIRDSGNVSSITDNGTGKYTVNFTTAMEDANYATIGNTVGASGTNTARLSVFSGISSQTTSSVIVTTVNTSNSAVDRDCNSVVIFR